MLPANGAPDVCSNQCAHVFLSVFQKCYGDMVASFGEGTTVFVELSLKCQRQSAGATAYAGACLDDAHRAQTLAALKRLQQAETPGARRVYAERVRSLIGVDADSRPAEACGDVELFIDAIADTDDTGGEARQAQLHGDAYVANGVHFGEPRCRRSGC